MKHAGGKRRWATYGLPPMRALDEPHRVFTWGSRESEPKAIPAFQPALWAR
jgi:hypothetical protein